MYPRIRLIVAVLTVCCCIAAFAFPCQAVTDDTLGSLYDSITPGELDIPPDVQAELEQDGISVSDPHTMLTLSPGALLRRLWDTARREAAAPLRLCGALLSLTLLSALLHSAGDTVSGHGMQQVLQTLCTLVCAESAAQPLCSALTRTAETLAEGQVFMVSYVPVFSSFLAAGGNLAGGAAYQVFILFLTELMMQLTTHLLFPLLQMAAAIGIVDAMNPKLHLGGFVSAFKTAVTWLLGTLMTLFTALLSIRSFVASAADSLTAKSVKLVSSALIPIVGGAVSEAYGTIQGSIRLLRSGIGAAGIFVILWMILPTLLSLLLYRVVFAVSRLFAEMTGTDGLSALYRHMQSVLGTAFAIIVCFGMMLIISSAVMLLLLQGE